MKVPFKYTLPVAMGIISVVLIVWDLHNQRVVTSMGMAWESDGARKRVLDVPDIPWWNDAFVSATTNGQPAIMANTGAAQVYWLRWK